MRNRHPHTKKVSEEAVSEKGNFIRENFSAAFGSNILIAYNDTELSNKALQAARKIARKIGCLSPSNLRC